MITRKEMIIKEKLRYLQERKETVSHYGLNKLEKEFEERHASDSVMLDMIMQA